MNKELTFEQKFELLTPENKQIVTEKIYQLLLEERKAAAK